MNFVTGSDWMFKRCRELKRIHEDLRRIIDIQCCQIDRLLVLLESQAKAQSNLLVKTKSDPDAYKRLMELKLPPGKHMTKEEFDKWVESD